MSNFHESSQNSERSKKLSRSNNQVLGLSVHFTEVAPDITDSVINNWLDAHYVAAASQLSSCRNQLLLFLSGSYGRPGRQLLFMQEAVNLGYHVINLNYPNSWTIAELCQSCQDKNCHEQVRLEIIDGVERSDKIKIGPANSIQHRLVRLLQHLKQQQPDENWEQFLGDDHRSPRWESIVVAGHSQGGGHAAMIAKEHIVSRVIMLSAPADYSPVHKCLAPWLAEPHATPVDRYYGFIHLKDPGTRRVRQAWKLIGLDSYNAFINVDRHHAPYDYSHCLITSANPGRPGRYHGCVVNDLQTPRLPDETPKFRSVWRYLLAANPQN